ncbi:MAG: NAD(P)-dependent oxidoreductase [Rhizobiales bacterium 32-66-8]|nr:MAG: NAD(P)-dependent oxidoreductase [Rhizobiales bacterium 32-66-8]
MMRILLFGVNGQVGRETATLAAERSIDFVGIDRATTDISDPVAVARILEAKRPDLVINAAAYTAVDKAESEPEQAARANALAPGWIAERCDRYRTPLIHISTEAGEAAVRAAAERHLILRTSWVYGAHGANFLKTMLRLAGDRDRLTVVADQRGCPTATRDIAEGLLAAAASIGAGQARWGTYHLAGTGVTTWHGFASEIIRVAAPLTGRAPEVAPITTADYPTPARRPANSELNSSQFERAFRFRAAPWQSRVADVVAQLLPSRPKDVS